MNDIRHQVEHYKMALHSGDNASLMLGGRATGRTQAILEYAHELLHCGKDVFVCCSYMSTARILLQRYRNMTDNEKLEPVFYSYAEVLVGRSPNTVILYDPVN
jgi:hypothetical protein